MNADDSCKLTVVTAPDLHLDPGATRILVLANYAERNAIQDEVGINWPAQDVTLYMSEGKTISDMDWIFMQMSVVDIVIVRITTIWDWVWPMLKETQAEVLFVIDDDKSNYQALIRSLKLTYPDKTFLNAKDAVQKAISLRT